MSQPILINPLTFARERQTLDGSMAVAELERLLEAVADPAGRLDWSLAGGVDKLDRPYLVLEVSGQVALTCQRCLDPLPFVVTADACITLFTDESKLEAASDEDSSLDAVMAEDELDVLALIEDEVLLGLPLAPRHEDCRPEALEAAKTDKPNPFAVLAALKRKPD
ncbi:metal-binding protein [Laribacter hongkongensis]|uniref:YceD family protein n=1 Tax=Laribacter hongkongensis TaxID=168471 RepID=UPI001878E722|nr:YceD family protein [Laribacter hongkongensis]MBE5528947.1 metal-binding protein [Laribacter hongkongensis]